MDSGKCVSGDTLIQAADGVMHEAQEAFETFKSGEATAVPDGIVHEAQGLQVLSVDTTGKVVPKNVSHVWKLQADKLVTVRTKAGYSVRTTPEHRFLVMTRTGESTYIEAGRLKLGDFLLVPSRSTVVQNDLGLIKDRILAMLSDDFLVQVSPSLNAQIIEPARGRLKQFGRVLGDRNFGFHTRTRYYRASVFRQLVRQSGLELAQAYDSILCIKFASKKMRATHNSPWISLPKTDEQLRDLAYIVGLLYGDGIAGTGRLSNTSADIIEEFRRCLQSAFGLGANQAWRRTAYTVSHRGGKSFSRFLVEVFDYPMRDKSRNLHVPRVIQLMPDHLLVGFLRGFFDAEGFVQTGRNIGVGCESKVLMKQLPLLLQRFGCVAYHGKSHSREVYISGKGPVSAFVHNIGFHDHDKMNAAKARLSSSETNRVFELTPIPGEFLKDVRKGNRVVWDDHFQLTSFEPYPKLSKGVLARLAQAVPVYRNEDLGRILENYYMVQIDGLQVSEGSFTVYDFTVDETHNFMANCLIIHNTSLLDALRGTAVQTREVGGITQEIGASFFPLETLEQICGPLLDRAGGELRIPGLLMIDTPGHAVFSNLRLRGGSAADIAIVVVDVLKGLENQTLESIDILKQRKVPFMVALNKVDMIKGWRKGSKGPLQAVLNDQPPEWNDELEERLYNVVGGLSRLGFQSDAYYRVKEFRQQVTIVPVSARAKIGIPELLAVLIGLSQHFLKGKLRVTDESRGGKGIILEMQEETGIGETANIVLTEGRLRVGDSIGLVRRDGAFKSKVKALFMPKPLDEMRDPRDKFTSVDSVYAAAGVKLVSADLAGVVAGTSVASFETDEQFIALKGEMEKELTNILVKTENMGVIVKAASVGGLEALLRMLEERGIPVRRADIGDITKNDIVDAEVVGEHDPYLGAILGFDSKVLPEAEEFVGSTQIFVSEVIYEVIDNYANWAAAKRESDQKSALSSMTRPCKLKVLPGAFFRRNDPAVFGVEVLAGLLKPKVRLMSSDGRELGMVEQIQENGKAVAEVKQGDKVAISVDGPTLGRQVKEEDTIYTLPRSHEARMLRTKFLGSLTEDEVKALEEIIKIKTPSDPLFGF